MRFPRFLTRAGPTGPGPGPSRRPVIAEADDLARTGRLADAVDRLAQSYRGTADPEVALRLVTLRHRAATELDAGPGRASWPPRYADPFPDVAGRPPEIDRPRLDTDVMGGAVAHHGCLVVRGLFDEAQVARTVDGIDRARAAQQEATTLGGDDDTGDPWYRPLPAAPRGKNRSLRAMVAQQGGVWLGDAPACTEQVLSDLATAGATSAIAGHFGERPFISLQKSTLRRSLPAYQLAAWHQDGSFLAPEVRTMNVWVALSRCGGDHPAPALEVIPRRIDEVLPVDGVMSPHSMSFALIDELARVTPTTVPAFASGDALLFDERFVHRTHLTETMTEGRDALECWFFAPSHRSPNYAPILV